MMKQDAHVSERVAGPAKITLAGSFPGLPSTLDFTVEFDKRFDGAGGENILFHSEGTSDHAGYVLALERGQ